LVYVTNLAFSLAKEEILRKPEYFGQYGKILKIVINKSHLYNVSSPHGPSVSAYITYAKKDDSIKAIAAVNGMWLEHKQLRASYGTTKYCAYFLRNLRCTNQDCMYLHEIESGNDSFTKEEIKHHLLPDVQTLAKANLERSRNPTGIKSQIQPKKPPTKNGEEIEENQEEQFSDEFDFDLDTEQEHQQQLMDQQQPHHNQKQQQNNQQKHQSFQNPTQHQQQPQQPPQPIQNQWLKPLNLSPPVVEKSGLPPTASWASSSKNNQHQNPQNPNQHSNQTQHQNPNQQHHQNQIPQNKIPNSQPISTNSPQSQPQMVSPMMMRPPDNATLNSPTTNPMFSSLTQQQQQFQMWLYFNYLQQQQFLQQQQNLQSNQQPQQQNLQPNQQQNLPIQPPQLLQPQNNQQQQIPIPIQQSNSNQNSSRTKSRFDFAETTTLSSSPTSNNNQNIFSPWGFQIQPNNQQPIQNQPIQNQTIPQSNQNQDQKKKKNN